MDKTWSFSQVWNQALEKDEPKIMETRERIWASELGGAMIDRWLKMRGVQPTNPPNARSKRKFEAGKLWESILGYVLRRAGILLESQGWVKYQYDGLLPVTGKLDFMAGGEPNYKQAENLIKQECSWLPPFITDASLQIINHLAEKFPDSLKKIILEIKSCSAFMFEIYEKNETASPQHKLQAFHYLKAKNMDEAHIVYICRDDCRIMEVGVFNPSSVEEMYKKDISDLTEYLKGGTRPPLEKPIVFDEAFKKFSANFLVGYSQYLTMLYGLKDQKEFDEKYKPVTERWNRLLGRLKNDKTRTKHNEETIREIKEAGFDIDKIKEVIQ